MNIAKNMEAIFVSALVVIGATTFATAAVPDQVQATAAVKADTAYAGSMPVVTVTAKRLTAEQKAALGN
ncbi:hypothetical protein ACLB1G_25390 [Oxalobacteraceae bacterium A2-2]